MMKLFCDGREIPIAIDARIANDPLSRTVGWIGRSKIDAQEALILPDCHAIHTFFMRSHIDVLFLDADYRIVHIVRDVPPMRPIVTYRGARHTIELLYGRADEMECALGDRLRIE